jgi:hypothetical protein
MSQGTPRRQLRINRNLVGLLSLGCSATGVSLLIVNGIYDKVGASFANIGALLWATWLILPRDGVLPAWMTPSPWKLIGVLVLAYAFIRRPLMMLPVLGSLVAGAVLLRPKR